MKLSIITINLNHKIGLSRTLDSVFEQTFSDYEYIVIDGDSTDGSAELIKEYSAKFSYYIIEKDGGIYDAMNKGLNKANGKYCLFLNSGDYLLSNDILEKVFAYNFSQDIVSGDVKCENNTEHRSPEHLSMYNFFIGSLAHQATFIKKKLLQKMNGYRTDFKIVSDWLFSIEAFVNNNATYKHLPITIAFYEGHGLSSNEKNANKERNRVWQEYFPYLINDLMYTQQLEEGKKELQRIYKIPGIKFIMKYIYPLYKNIKGKTVLIGMW